jgi:hypothetical protein
MYLRIHTYEKPEKENTHYGSLNTQYITSCHAQATPEQGVAVEPPWPMRWMLG